jgi:magnesium transporter
MPEKFAEAPETGIVDQHPDPPASPAAFGVQPARGIGLGQIQGQRPHRDGVASHEFLAQGFQRLAVAGGQNQGISHGGKAAGKRGADAATGPGDQGVIDHVCHRGYGSLRYHVMDTSNQPHTEMANQRVSKPSRSSPKDMEQPTGVMDGARSREGAASPALEEPASPARRGALSVTCTDFSPDRVEFHTPPYLDRFIDEHRPEWSKVRWINVVGGTCESVLSRFARKYQLHPLAVEDILVGQQRPKVEDFPASQEAPGRLFIVARLANRVDGAFQTNQINLFLGRNTLLTFLDESTAVFDSIYKRLEYPGSRLRANDASFLCYALLDAIVDSYFPVLEHYSACLEEIEEELLDEPRKHMLQKAHTVKRGLLLLRRSIWPMRELIAQLQRERHECLSENTLTYFRDVYDHCVQILDLNETYHEIATALTETYMSVISNHMNEVVKVLTIISTIFIPLTFVAGVYGMNMPIPENEWEWSYPVFWIVCLSIVAAMLTLFRRRGWI